MNLLSHQDYKMRIIIDNKPFIYLLVARYYKFLLLLLLFTLFLLALTMKPEGITNEGYRISVIFILAAILWSTNLIPPAITSLLVLFLIPALSIMPAKKTFAFFGNEPLFFILSAFIISVATEKSGLAKRISINILSNKTTSPTKLAFSIYYTGLIMSFFMPEHAVAVLLLPLVSNIAGLLKIEKKSSVFGKLLFLSLAYGTIIGGIATFLGGARNALAVGLLEEISGESISFFEWLRFSFPIVLLLQLVCLIFLKLFLKPEKIELDIVSKNLKRELEMLPPFTFKEVATFIIIVLTVAGWLIVGHRGVGLAGVAIISAVLFFIFGIIEWKDAERGINWSAFLMYGSAITLGAVFAQTDAGAFLIQKLDIQNINPETYLIIAGATALVLTEFISNATVVALILPIFLKTGIALKIDPKFITASIALMSGLAFMLPVGTPAHFLCYSKGYYTISDSIKVGALLNILSLFILYLAIKLFW